MADTDNPLDGVQALAFDVFGTIVNYREGVALELRRIAPDHISEEDAYAFADEWRQGYYRVVAHIAGGGEGPLVVDVLHRQLLDEMLASPRWSHLKPLWDEAALQDLNLIWHRLPGWPDVSEGIRLLNKHFITAVLSNGNVRLLADMAKNADLDWDVIFSGEIFGIYKPHPKTYQGAASYLSLQPHQVAMVAAHIGDLRGAMRAGLKSIYIPRPTEDKPEVTALVKTKKEGGEVDVMIPSGSLVELAKLVEQWQGKHWPKGH
ncbi:hypothetical protein PLICRDRAFT_127149 [Plicaturopsis crispa FD-325 SS-3]|uniref:Haloacid dehalogenase n=1 Tax=Plicaturopsis crispa FD-325 SS-3 TaxID=944288 RepID=A0A0C9SQN5_PLICR|nr:hypothetical protein PLICRDRAFT_127149 [Plicaturopsis crispa FD-325 SS-3]